MNLRFFNSEVILNHSLWKLGTNMGLVSFLNFLTIFLLSQLIGHSQYMHFFYLLQGVSTVFTITEMFSLWSIKNNFSIQLKLINNLGFWFVLSCSGLFFLEEIQWSDLFICFIFAGSFRWYLQQCNKFRTNYEFFLLQKIIIICSLFRFFSLGLIFLFKKIIPEYSYIAYSVLYAFSYFTPYFIFKQKVSEFKNFKLDTNKIFDPLNPIQNSNSNETNTNSIDFSHQILFLVVFTLVALFSKYIISFATYHVPMSLRPFMTIVSSCFLFLGNLLLNGSLDKKKSISIQTILSWTPYIVVLCITLWSINTFIEIPSFLLAINYGIVTGIIGAFMLNWIILGSWFKSNKKIFLIMTSLSLALIFISTKVKI